MSDEIFGGQAPFPPFAPAPTPGADNETAAPPTHGRRRANKPKSDKQAAVPVPAPAPTPPAVPPKTRKPRKSRKEKSEIIPPLNIQMAMKVAGELSKDNLAIVQEILQLIEPISALNRSTVIGAISDIIGE